MKLLTIVMAKRSEAQADRLLHLVELFGERLHKENKIRIVLDRGNGLQRVEVSAVMPAFRLQADGHALYEAAAGAIADYLLAEEEQRLLRRMIRHEFHYKQDEETDSILSYCSQMLGERSDSAAVKSDKSEAYLRRKNKLIALLTEYIEEYTELNLDGFLRFRAPDYLNELREVVEYAIDEFVMDRQYREFISLLQYFVYIQEAKVPFVHLIHKGGSEFMLFGEHLEKIETNDTDAVVTVETLEKDMNFEDMIVSTLITVSPQQIYIHTREPDLQVIKTIRQIFENRVELCGYCRLCQNLDRSTAAEYNKG